jgi:hypothetical protein
MRPANIAASVVPDTVVSDVGKLSTVRVPGEGGTAASSQDRNRSPVGSEFATCRVASPGGAGVAAVKGSANGAAAVAVAVSVAGPGATVVKVPFRAVPRPMKPTRSMAGG